MPPSCKEPTVTPRTPAASRALKLLNETSVEKLWDGQRESFINGYVGGAQAWRWWELKTVRRTVERLFKDIHDLVWGTAPEDRRVSIPHGSRRDLRSRIWPDFDSMEPAKQE
jgi:hypothetical protein